MDEEKFLAEQFKANRSHLKSVAYRMLGSMSEAEDAVQETWLRLSRAEASDIRNMGGWLTTVISRVALDMLRARKSRREDPLGPTVTEPSVSHSDPGGFEHEAMMADSVGLAMLVVLQQLTPAERIAFVLHDMFDLPFDDIAPIVDRTPEAARQLASRARRRVQGKPSPDEAELASNRSIVAAFLTASRTGDLRGLLAVLDPNVIMRADVAAMNLGAISPETRGADAVAHAFAGRARNAQVGLVGGAIGVIIAPEGQLRLVLEVVIRDGKIVEISSVADKDTLANMEMTVLE
ncbi:sigma-70 family RNA polymerase sigma factor [Rhizobium sp. TH2]|uniref:sigma-70 family RNA polymerase sigma factor n=1 Tax=Rhizobium sp. TH2 TaxID=2775403 RepID=UPI002157955E|nr:sigma-70 family RNA polymerase sigma factor [Rhizobium sp. TH2]UVC08944.1 sigma-70 family RNA polymerase sigma factor [Rhizobium sp. TH2]